MAFKELSVFTVVQSGNESLWRSFTTSIPKRQSCSLQKKPTTLTTPASDISHLSDYVNPALSIYTQILAYIHTRKHTYVKNTYCDTHATYLMKRILL